MVDAINREKTNSFGNKLKMSGVLKALEQEESFSVIKLCHGFWENCVRIERRLKQYGLEEPLELSDLEDIVDELPIRWPASLFLDTIPYLRSAHRYPNVLTLISHEGWSEGFRIEGTPFLGLENTTRQVAKYVSSRAPLYDGLFWKNSIQDGSFSSFIDALKSRPVVIVGPTFTKNFADFSGLQNSVFVEVHAQKAAWNRHETVASVSEHVKKLGSAGTVCLIEAGSLNSTWMVYELANRFPKSYFLSLGQALNICSWEHIKKTNWYAVHHGSINQTIVTINRSWAAQESAKALVNFDSEFTENQSLNIRLKNQHPTLVDIVQNKSEKPQRPGKTPIPFIENKAIDESLLGQILQTSKNQNHWANFGPAVEMLEDAVHRLLELPGNRRVVSCKSATDALMALVGMHENNAGRKLNWVVSAFGFFSTRLGLLASAKVLDCDPNGIISLPELKMLNPQQWDGVIITNPFSLAENMSPIIEFARSMGKIVIVDNAAAMFSCERHHSEYPEEIISFHQTKPWGMGEGGCAIVKTEAAPIIRSLTNFGVGLSDSAAKYAQSSKMSDFDAALILQRLVDLPNWQPLYKLQKRRIMSVASPLGLDLLKPAPLEFLSAHVPLLSSRVVDKKELENPHLILRKYYKPLATGLKNAQSIYDRIVCVPCHPDVANCPTKDLGQLLIRFTK